MDCLSTQDYLALPRNPTSWVIEDILPTGGLLNIYGKPKSHKSFLALQIAAAVGSEGTIPDVIGLPVRSYGRVIYVQVDTPRGLWCDRMIRFFPSIRDVFWADSEMIEPFPYDVTGEGYHWLKRQVSLLQPLVVIIDTLREIHEGDENDSAHMKRVVSTIQAAVRPSACVVLSHARKNQNENFSIMDENRGSGYVAGRMDAVLYLSKSKLKYHTRTAGETEHQIVRTPLVQLKDQVDAYATRLVLGNLDAREADLTHQLMARFPLLTEGSARAKIRHQRDKLQTVEA